MKVLKTILKVIMTFILFDILVQLFRGIGFTILSYFNIDINLEFGSNIGVSIEILSVIIALFLSIKSYKNRKYLKWIIIGLVFTFITLLASIVVTKIILKSSADVNSSVEIISDKGCTQKADQNYISNLQKTLFEWNGKDIAYKDKIIKMILIIENNGTAKYKTIHSENREMQKSVIEFIDMQKFDAHNKCTPYRISVIFKVKGTK